jgi:hypothetical protein
MGRIEVRLGSSRTEARGWRWIHTAYFAEGLVSAAVTAVAAVLFKRLGASNETVTLLLAALALPWSLKPLFSPFLEVAGTKRLVVVLTEGVIATGLLAIAVGLSSPDPMVPCLALLPVITGGRAASRLGLGRSLPGLCVAFHVPAAVYLLLASQRPHSLVVVAAAIVGEQVVYGLGSVGLTLVMMQVAGDGSYPMSQFAFLAGISGVGPSLTGMASGWLQERVGYPAFFGWTMVAAAPAVFAAFVCSKRLPASAREPAGA